MLKISGSGILSHIATHLVLLLFVLGGATSYKKAQGSVVSNLIGVKFSRIVPGVNMYRLTEADLGYKIILSMWRPWN